MKTISEAKRITTLQYVVESLIDSYHKAKAESDKYYIKLELLTFIEEYAFDVSAVRAYIDLQPEKFSPFISFLASVKNDEPAQPKSFKPSKSNILDVEIFSINRSS